MMGGFKFLLIAAVLGIVYASPLRESRLDLIEGRATGSVHFYLYTKSNPKTPQKLVINDANSIKNSNFNEAHETKIIIHGWGGSYTSSPNPSVRDAYLSKGNYNIISIDWNEFSKLNYISARAKVPSVGEDIAELIDYLNKDFGLSFQKLVVIGHSLGAHVAGYTGKNVKRGKLVAIVGLDPAMPLYSYDNPNTRLSTTDADYVQTIQTNGGEKGFLNPIGSASFYANWGRSQPGCGLDLDGTCAHGRSVTYYAEAVKGLSFSPIYKCKSFENISQKTGCDTKDANAEIGDPLEIKRVNGIFYFQTNDEAPFGHAKARFEHL